MSAREERIKLTASFLNIVAAGFITTGTLGPLLTFLFSHLFDNTDPTLIAVGTLICLFLGVCIHLIGKTVLGALDD
jgi:ABC-type spermidine/putrescine transport system permease subunit II